MRAKILSVITLALSAAIACSCNHTQTRSAEAQAPKSFVSIAVVDQKMADHITAVLKDAGISAIVDGSAVYGVSVPGETKEAAIEVLKKDSARLKYWIQFP
jgi:hypothetical protein